MGTRNEEQLINQLVSETCERQSESTGQFKVLDFQRHFEKKSRLFNTFSDVIEFLEDQHVTYIQCHLEESSKCYRGMVDGKPVDFPSNWSFFSEVKGQAVFLAGNSPERDLLLDLFSEMEPGIVEAAFYFDGENLLISLWNMENFGHLYESFMFINDAAA